MKPYLENAETVLNEMGSSMQGLSDAEASQRLGKYGPNKLKEAKKESLLMKFLAEFRDPMTIVLIIAAGVSAVTAIYAGESLADTFIILLVVIINACLGVYQENKAEAAIEALQQIAAATAKVLRGGHQKTIPAEELVPGDIVVLEAGDCVPADARIVECASLKVEEAALTGESTDVEKQLEAIEVPGGGDVTLGDRKNMVYMGSDITYGRGHAVVTGTGMETQMGSIAGALSSAGDEETPLQLKLKELSRKLSVMILLICAFVFLVNLIRNGGAAVLDTFMIAVSLAVAAIPEGLSAVVTILLSIGVTKMSKNNAIIRKLTAVETLGCTQIICSDKTGTLTQNKMTVQRIYINGESIREEELDIRLESHRRLIYDMVLNNDSSIVDGKGIGDPTEYALIETSRSIGLDENIIRDTLGRVEEVPFDSDRKMMSSKYRLHGVPHILTKGALDSILDRCVSIATKDGVRPITDEDKKIILDQNNKYSEEGLRVLTFAYKESDEALSVETEYNYTFLGLVAMIDPPREESKAAVADAIRAGIKPIMITGDHKITASAIAKQIGIMRDGDMAVTGMELDAMNDEELDRVLEKISVYARVSPENKIRIVEAWQRKGNIVSMTGDGVNDAPALKKADIGVAMGITGTEVSKDAASMILQDDNFATIIKAVANGRNVYRNIRNSILFLLSGNMAAIITVLFTSIMALPVPFEPVHLLFINLLTDSLPALAIGMEKPEDGLLSQKPRDPNKGILTKDFTALMFGQGALIAVVVVVAFYLGLPYGASTAATMAFATLTLARLFHGFNCRSKRSIFSLGLLSNLYSVGAFVLGCLLLALVLFVPALHSLFCVEAMDGMMYAYIALLAFAPTVVIQIIKAISDKVNKTS